MEDSINIILSPWGITEEFQIRRCLAVHAASKHVIVTAA